MPSLERICKQLLIKDPFYGLFMLSLNKQYDDKVPTAGVCFNGINVELHVNQEWFEALTEEQALDVVRHEMTHICLGHLTEHFQFGNHQIANIAEDTTINQYLSNLPDGCVTLEITSQMCGEKLEALQSSKYYYDHLNQKAEEIQQMLQQMLDNGELNPDDLESNNVSGNGFGIPIKLNPKNMGDHSGWENKEFNEAEKQLVEQQINSNMKEAAEQVQKSCGKIPGELSEIIKKLFEKNPPVFNWKQYFRRLVGASISSDIQMTRMRPSKRFPDARGIKLKRKANIFVGVDTSGSVSNKELQEFFAEIQHIYKAGSRVTVAECDTQINKIWEYKGMLPEYKVSGRGGTTMIPLFEYYKSHPEYSCMIIFTDAYLFDNDWLPARNVIWVITSEGNREFNAPGKKVFIPNRNNK